MALASLVQVAGLALLLTERSEEPDDVAPRIAIRLLPLLPDRPVATPDVALPPPQRRQRAPDRPASPPIDTIPPPEPAKDPPTAITLTRQEWLAQAAELARLAAERLQQAERLQEGNPLNSKPRVLDRVPETTSEERVTRLDNGDLLVLTHTPTGDIECRHSPPPLDMAFSTTADLLLPKCRFIKRNDAMLEGLEDAARPGYLRQPPP